MPNHAQTSQSRVRTQAPASMKNKATALWYQSVTASTNTAEIDAKLVRNSIMSRQLRNEFLRKTRTCVILRCLEKKTLTLTLTLKHDLFKEDQSKFLQMSNSQDQFTM